MATTREVYSRKHDYISIRTVLFALAEGKEAWRSSWIEENGRFRVPSENGAIKFEGPGVKMVGDKLIKRTGADEYSDWMPTMADMMADDWCINWSAEAGKGAEKLAIKINEELGITSCY